MVRKYQKKNKTNEIVTKRNISIGIECILGGVVKNQVSNTSESKLVRELIENRIDSSWKVALSVETGDFKGATCFLLFLGWSGKSFQIEMNELRVCIPFNIFLKGRYKVSKILQIFYSNRNTLFY